MRLLLLGLPSFTSLYVLFVVAFLSLVLVFVLLLLLLVASSMALQQNTKVVPLLSAFAQSPLTEVRLVCFLCSTSRLLPSKNVEAQLVALLVTVQVEPQLLHQPHEEGVIEIARVRDTRKGQHQEEVSALYDDSTAPHQHFSPLPRVPHKVEYQTQHHYVVLLFQVRSRVVFLFPTLFFPFRTHGTCPSSI